MTASMKLLTKIAVGIATGVLGLMMAVGMVLLLGLMMETAAENSEQHDRCLKQATNGYEIRRCR